MKYSRWLVLSRRWCRVVVSFGAIVLWLSSCNFRKHIPEGGHLVTKIKIKNAPTGTKGELEALSAQKPNKKLFGLFRYNMWQYLWATDSAGVPNKEVKRKKALVKAESKLEKVRADGGDSSKVAKYQKRVDKAKRKLESTENRSERLANSVWEEPSVLDCESLLPSAKQMGNYLKSLGYLQARVTAKSVGHSSKAKLIYTVDEKSVEHRFYIHRFEYEVADTALRTIVTNYLKDKRWQPKMKIPYEETAFATLRDSLTFVFKQNGHYNFNRSYIYFNVDTNSVGDSIKVKMIISNPKGLKKHPLYKIQRVVVVPEYDPSAKPGAGFSRLDTLGMELLGSTKLIDPSWLAQFIYLHKGDLYNIDNYNATLVRLSFLEIYRSIDITFGIDTIGTPDDTFHLIVNLKLIPTKRLEIGVDYEVNAIEQSQDQVVTVGSRLLGTSLSLLYNQKMLNRTGARFDTRLTGAVEVPISLFSNEPVVARVNYLASLSNRLRFPKVLLPRGVLSNWLHNVDKKTPISTDIALNFIYEDNRDFQRSTVNTNITYQWTSKLERYFLTPLDISLVDTRFGNADFEQRLRATGDPILINLFAPHIITDARFQYLYRSQPLSIVKEFQRFSKVAVEVGGNTLALINSFFKTDTSAANIGTDKIGNVQYFQYARLELDNRFYFPTGGNTNLAFRTILGFGLPYGRSTILPFEKRFFIGGANSVRAYRLRELGPGAYKPLNVINFDRSGDLKFETNLEFRFPLSDIIKIGVFADAGNVWTYKEDAARPGSQFKLETFADEIALGAGLGLRLDFNFFVFRVDFATPLSDPSQDLGARWLPAQPDYSPFNRVNINLGVGLPF